MVKIEAVKKMVKNKVLLYGSSGTGKTHTALMVSFLFSEHGKNVCYVDPEFGAQKEIVELAERGELRPEQVENITMFITPKWKTGKFEEKDDGVVIGGFVDIFDQLNGDLIVVDSMNELMRIHKIYLEQKFIAQGYYVVGEKKFEIKDVDTWTLPWNYYPKLYDELIGMIYKLLMKPGHVICTMHPIGDNEARRKVEEDIFKKFDTIIATNVTTVENRKEWYGIVKKNRGKDVVARISKVDEKLVEMFRRVIE